MIFYASDLGLEYWTHSHNTPNRPPIYNKIWYFKMLMLLDWSCCFLIFWYSLELCLGVGVSNTQARRPSNHPPLAIHNHHCCIHPAVNLWRLFNARQIKSKHVFILRKVQTHIFANNSSTYIQICSRRCRKPHLRVDIYSNTSQQTKDCKYNRDLEYKYQI